MKQTLLRESLRFSIEKMRKLDRRSMPKNCHFSFIVVNNRILEWGTNRYQSIPKHWGYDVTFQGLHSEMSAYIRGSGLILNKPFSLINVRFSNFMHLKLSKPCPDCTRMMTSLGCTECVYTTPNGWVTEKF